MLLLEDISRCVVNSDIPCCHIVACSIGRAESGQDTTDKARRVTKLVLLTSLFGISVSILKAELISGHLTVPRRRGLRFEHLEVREKKW